MKQSIAFAFYRNGELLGYRRDTFGALTMTTPKIYTYSKEQVDIVVRCVNSMISKPNVWSEFFSKAMGVNVATDIRKEEDKTQQLLGENKIFEIRVVVAPDKTYEKEFNVDTARYEEALFPTYPSKEEIEQWLQYPEQHEVLETHYFSQQGEMIMS